MDSITITKSLTPSQCFHTILAKEIEIEIEIERKIDGAERIEIEREVVVPEGSRR